jgi:hypothetical protein
MYFPDVWGRSDGALFTVTQGFSKVLHEMVGDVKRNRMMQEIV